MKTFRAKAIGRQYFYIEIEAETEEEAWEKAEALPYDEWERDENALYFDPNFGFEITSVEEN